MVDRCPALTHVKENHPATHSRVWLVYSVSSTSSTARPSIRSDRNCYHHLSLPHLTSPISHPIPSHPTMNFSPSRPRFSTNPSITTATTTITPSSSTLTHSPTLYFPLASNSSLGHVDETNESLDISSMEALQPPPVPPRPTHIRKDWNPLGTADGFSPSKSEGDGVPPPPIPPRMKKKTSSPPTTTVNTSLQGGGKIRRMSIDTALGISSPDDQEIPKEREDVVMKDGDKIPTDTTYTGSLTSKPDLSRAQSGMSLDTGTPTGMTADAGSVMSGGITPAATATATGEGSSRRRPLPPRPHHPPTVSFISISKHTFP